MPHRLFLAAFLLSVLCSCSTSFQREWQQAIKAGPGSGVEGAWSGTWHSDVNGHHGTLRCVVSPKNDQHQFHYHATWMRVLSGSYAASKRVTPVRGGYRFEGQHQMPAWAGGLYTYKGTVRDDDFQATYQCAKDRGAFAMKRVR